MIQKRELRKVLLFLLVFASVVLLTGCSSSPAVSPPKDKFIGTWVGNVPQTTLKRYLIVDSSDGKTYSLTLANDETGKGGFKDTAVKKDDYLEVSQFERLAIAPDGTITFRSGTFSKMK